MNLYPNSTVTGKNSRFFAHSAPHVFQHTLRCGSQKPAIFSQLQRIKDRFML